MSSFSALLAAKGREAAESRGLGHLFGGAATTEASAPSGVAPESTHSAELPALIAARSAADVSGLRFPLTLLRGVWATDYETKTATPPELVAEGVTAAGLIDALASGEAPSVVSGGLRGSEGTALKRAKESFAVYALPFALPAGVPRSASTVTAGHWLGVDLDGVPEPEVRRVLTLLRSAGIWALCHSTFNHGLKDTAKGWRVRLVLLLDRMAPAAEYRKCYLNACALLGVEVGRDKSGDTANSTPAQLIGAWCVPSAEVVAADGLPPPVFAPFKESNDGGALCVDALLRYGGAPAVPVSNVVPLNLVRAAGAVASDDLQAGMYGPDTIERVNAALEWLDPACGYNEWVAVLNHLFACGRTFGEQQMFDLAVKWSDRAPAERRANNENGKGPADVWATLDPQRSSIGGLCALAQPHVLNAARAARGAPAWVSPALDALIYLQAYSRAALSEFTSGGYPAMPQQAASTGLVVGFEFKADQYGNPVAVGRVGGTGRLEALPVWDQSFVDALLLQAADAGRKLPGRDVVEQLRSLVSARVRREGERCTVSRRVALPSSGVVVVDLGDRAGAGVSISADGWRVSADHGVLFSRSPGYGELPAPGGDGQDLSAESVSAAWQCVGSMFTVLGIAPREAALLTVVALKWLYPSGAYPVVELLGAAGSGKTTAAHLLAMIFDPRGSGRAVTPRTLNIVEFAPLAQAHAVLVLDNLSRLSAAEQDLLCVTATGAEIGTRVLHTTGQTVVMAVHARVLATGITPAFTRIDLLNRCIRVLLAAPSPRRSEEELAQWFNSEKPRILGALFTLLAAAIKHLPEVKPATHRLVEFQRLGFAVYRAMGLDPDEFEALFAEHRGMIAGYNADADPFLRTLLAAIEFAESKAVAADSVPGWRAWAEKGKAGYCAIRQPGGAVFVAATSSGLLDLMKAKAPTDIQLDRHDRDAAIPKHARALEGAVTRVEPTLRDLGWKVARKEFMSKRAALVFARIGPSESRN